MILCFQRAIQNTLLRWPKLKGVNEQPLQSPSWWKSSFFFFFLEHILGSHGKECLEEASLSASSTMDVSTGPVAVGRRTLAQCCSSSSCISPTGPHSSALLAPIATIWCQHPNQVRFAGQLGIHCECAPVLNSGGVSWEAPDGLKNEKRPV